MKQLAIDLIYVILAFIASVILVAIIYGAFGAVFYFGMPTLGIKISYHQAFILALLISVVGMLFRGGNGSNARKQTKGDDALSE